MDEQEEGVARLVTAVGRDHVTVGAGRLVIHSPVDMVDWAVRPYRKPAVVFEGLRWELVAKGVGSHGTVRYDFVPWPADRSEAPGMEIVYDEAFVQARDGQLHEKVQRERAEFAWSLVLPLIGFLWGGPKQALQVRHLLPVVEATRQSVFIEYATMLICGVLFTISAFVGGLGGARILSPGALLLTLIVLLVDVVFRKDALMRGDTIPPGFYEWTVRRAPPPGWGTGRKRDKAD